MKKRSIFKRAVSLLLAVICLPVLSSCFHDNWNIPEREEPDMDIGALLGGLLGGVGGIENINRNEILPTGIVLSPSADGSHYIVADGSGCTAKRISIPSSYRGVPVSEIADGAFAGLETLEEIWIPSSIKRVGANVFEGCDSLKYTEEEGVLYLGNNDNPHLVLVRTSKRILPMITINESTRVIADKAFFENTTSGEVVIPDSVVTVGQNAFGGCLNIYSLVIGDGVEEICDEAFSGIDFLEKLTLGKSLVRIGNYAFYGCKSLASLDIPDSVTEIGESAFYGCSAMESLTIGNGLRVIPQGAFSMCHKLQKILFGSSVEVIESEAFNACTALETVNLPDGLECIFTDSFKGCAWLNYNTYADGKYLGSADNPYAYLMDLDVSDPANTAIVLHKDTRRIAATLSSSFNDKRSVIILNVLSSAVANSGTYLHVNGNCIIDTEQKKLIGGFFGATIPDDGSVTSIADYAFYGMDRLSIKRIPLSVREIGDYAFASCSAISEITVYGARSIGQGAFRNCGGLMSINLKSDLNSIGEYAFANCPKLTDFAIPDSVSEIGVYAFKGCINVEYVYISASVKNIPEGLFDGCTQLVSANHSAELVSIGANAFRSCRRLEVFDFNHGIEYIGDCAFKDCSTLRGIRLTNSVKRIGTEAFCDCTGAAGVSIGNGITEIGDSAFDGITCEIEYNGLESDLEKVKIGQHKSGLLFRFTDGGTKVVEGERDE